MELQTTHQPRLREFFDIYGEELDQCNPNAYDLLVEILEGDADIKAFEDFAWDYADELDACHPDAFDLLYEIAKDLGIEL